MMSRPMEIDYEIARKHVEKIALWFYPLWEELYFKRTHKPVDGKNWPDLYKRLDRELAEMFEALFCDKVLFVVDKRALENDYEFGADWHRLKLSIMQERGVLVQVVPDPTTKSDSISSSLVDEGNDE